MASLLRNTIYLFSAISLSLIACSDDENPCLGVVAPAGYLCENGKIIEDPEGFCYRTTCPEGFVCDAILATCVPIDACKDVICPTGFSCQNGNCVPAVANTIVVSGFISTDTKWNSSSIYELAGKVVVLNGATLTIEAGTIIKGREGTGSLATALIISRGAKLRAEGTAEKPIIFTSVLDNIRPGQFTGTNLTELDNEKWGGLIVLGRAPISAENGDTEALIEGIPADDGFGSYGGQDPEDNSGLITYVSIRHGGAEIGEGNEINGLTLGGVGSGTVIENVEVVANLDDGIEFFGGTVNVKNVIVSLVGDDAIDIDQNYSGTVDNFVVIQGDGVGTDEALEIDGPENKTYTSGLFVLKNGSIISLDGAGSAADFKSGAQGMIHNVSWANYSNFLKVRASYSDNCSKSKKDAFQNIVSGLLKIEGNQFVIPANDLAIAYTGSTGSDGSTCSVPESDQLILDEYINSHNSKVSQATIGANTAVFAWSWTVRKNKL